MAENENRKAELIATLDRARREMSEHGRGARSSMNVSRRMRTGFQRHTVPWVVGAIVVGSVLAWLPRRKQKIPVKKIKLTKDTTAESAGKASLLLVAGKLLLDVTRPFMMRWITQQIEPLATRWISGRSHNGKQSAPAGAGRWQ